MDSSCGSRSRLLTISPIAARLLLSESLEDEPFKIALMVHEPVEIEKPLVDDVLVAGPFINVCFTSNVAHMTLFQTEAEEGSIPNLRLAQRPSGVNDYRESRQTDIATRGPAPVWSACQHTNRDLAC